MKYIEIIDADYNNTGAYVTTYAEYPSENNLPLTFKPSTTDECVKTIYLHFD